jgi:translation elongation factor EF-G
MRNTRDVRCLPIRKGNDDEDIEARYSEGICTIIGASVAAAGDMQCDGSFEGVSEQLTFLGPLIRMPIEPKSKLDDKTWH